MLHSRHEDQASMTTSIETPWPLLRRKSLSIPHRLFEPSAPVSVDPSRPGYTIDRELG